MSGAKGERVLLRVRCGVDAVEDENKSVRESVSGCAGERASVRVHVCFCAHVRVCMRACMRACMYACIRACEYVRVRACVLCVDHGYCRGAC